MTFKLIRCYAGFILFSLGMTAFARINAGEQQTLDFTDPATSAGVTPARLPLQPDGTLLYQPAVIKQEPGVPLVYDPAKDRGNITSTATWSPDCTQTSAGLLLSQGSVTTLEAEPFHVGFDSQPLTATIVQIRLEATGLRPLGWSPRPLPFVRFSTDGKLWSSWQALTHDCVTETTGVENYQGIVAVASTARGGYEAAFREWAYPQPASGAKSPYSGANSDVFYKWLILNYPDVLKTEIPLIRFLQVRVEFPHSENVTVTRLTTRTSWSVSGLRQ